MAISEADILNGIKPTIGTAEKLFDVSEESPLVQVTQKYLTEVTKEMRKVLTKEGRNGSRSLAQSLNVTPVTSEIGGFKSAIDAVKYADFVDKGVNAADLDEGVAPPPYGPPVQNALPAEANGNKPYKFKNLYYSKSMLQAIQQWIPYKRQEIPFDNMGAIIGTAINIKKRGIKPANFIARSTGGQAEKEFENSITEIIGQSINIQFGFFGDEQETKK